MTHVLDTNVLVIANGQHDGDRDLVCELAAVKLIAEIRHSRALIGIDRAGEILKEYGVNTDVSKPPRVGAQLLIQLYRNENCYLVDLTKNHERGYEEFPDDERLERFDGTDRKFVAVALASGEHRLSVATDSDFYDHKDALQDCGVRLNMICPHLFERVADR